MKKGVKALVCRISVSRIGIDHDFLSISVSEEQRLPFADDEADGGDEADDPDKRGEVTRRRVHVHDAHLHPFVLQQEPARRRHASEHDDGEQLREGIKARSPKVNKLI